MTVGSGNLLFHPNTGNLQFSQVSGNLLYNGVQKPPPVLTWATTLPFKMIEEWINAGENVVSNNAINSNPQDQGPYYQYDVSPVHFDLFINENGRVMIYALDNSPLGYMDGHFSVVGGVQGVETIGSEQRPVGSQVLTSGYSWWGITQITLLWGSAAL